jgi:hypothetical protein
MEKCGMILTPITSAAARSAATKSVMQEHYLQNMDTLGLQQLEHLEKELEQAKQKVTKFLQLKPQGIIDQTARRNQPSDLCDDHDSCEVVRKLNTNAHTVHTLKKKQKKKNTQKTKELECVRIQLRLGFDSFKRFVCSKAMAAALHFCWEKIALKTKDLCVVLVGDGRWGFFLLFFCCRYLC